MKESNQTSRLYHFGFFVWILGLSLVLLSTDKLKFHLLINKQCTKFSDDLFLTLTHLGDGFFAISFSLLVFFVNIRKGVFMLITFCLSGVLVQFLKRVVFDESMRPIYYLKNNPNLYLIEGFDYHIQYSFPSGHATSIFSIATMFCLLNTKLSYFTIVVIFIAFLTAFSRVYLSQHFLIDIYVGSIIGYLSSVLIHYILKKKLKSIDRPLFNNNS